MSTGEPCECNTPGVCNAKTSWPSGRHCWHMTVSAFMTITPQHGKFCCHCGARRNHAYMSPPAHALPDYGNHRPHKENE